VSAPRFDLCGSGSMVVDRIWSVPRIAGPDEKVRIAGASAGLIERRVGGVTLNHLGWARLLGLRVAAFGKQADDAEGRLLRAGMARLGIEPHLDASGRTSSTAEIFVDAAGQRAIYMSPASTAELTPADVDGRFASLIAASRMVSSEVSQLRLATVERILARARAAGARTVLDLDIPPRAAVPELGSDAELHSVLGLADLLKASLSAASEWVGAREPRAVARALAERHGAEAVVLTLGAQGAWVRTGAEEFAVPSARVAVRDTTGAGDAFLGGLLAGVHLELDWRDAALLGNACAAACCERIGAFPEEPDACRKRALEYYAELGGSPLVLPQACFGEAAAAPRETFMVHALQELGRVAAELDGAAVAAAAQLIRDAEASGGRTHVTGIGKSAHVARYLAALLSSTGTPSAFLDAGEATHGSVGQLVAGDVLIAISNSGQTEELLACARAAAVMGAQVIAVTASRESPLASAADLSLPVRVDQEGGPLGLAPRASVLAQTLVLLALSVELQAGRDFAIEDYHRRHPAGDLGRRSGR
jgi:sugar/nucleoside kinase (ribokinase family)/D-arabinose 5-phosphate isomerase GutQ